MNPAALLNPQGARRRGNYSLSSSLSVYHDIPQGLPESLLGAMQWAPTSDPSTASPPEEVPFWLTHDGETAMRQQEPVGPQPTPQLQFDPRALLNPSSVSKRPATESDPERGRENGQLSLVERLHNIHERTVSPAKRAKMDDAHTKTPPRSTLGSEGATLDLAEQNNQRSIPTSGPAIDLTNSKKRTAIGFSQILTAMQVMKTAMTVMFRSSKITLSK